MAPDDQFDPAVAALNDGTFVVVWTRQVGPLRPPSRFATFQPPACRYAIRTRTSTTTSDIQSEPSVTATAAGFLIAWTSGSDIRAQLFNNNDQPASDIFVVNGVVAAGSQTNPHAAGLADGRFVITWTDPGLDPAQADSSGNSVRAQIFDPRTAAVTLVGTSFGDDLVGTPFGDTMNGVAGNDTLAGGGGDDTIGGGDGNDTLLGGPGADIASAMPTTTGSTAAPATTPSLAASAMTRSMAAWHRHGRVRGQQG